VKNKTLYKEKSQFSESEKGSFDSEDEEVNSNYSPEVIKSHKAKHL
jgi:hypothetical protein